MLVGVFGSLWWATATWAVVLGGMRRERMARGLVDFEVAAVAGALTGGVIGAVLGLAIGHMVGDAPPPSAARSPCRAMPDLLIRIKKKTTDRPRSPARAPTAAYVAASGRQARRFFPLHDLTHYAVETVLGFRRGFYGLLGRRVGHVVVRRARNEEPHFRKTPASPS